MKITKKIAERITLRDDATETGGISYIGETLDNFMAEAGVPFGSSLKRVNEALVECGIEPLCKEEVMDAANPFAQEEIDVFVKIARVSKMDCWFDMEPDGRVLDYENNSGHKINRNVGLSQLIDGMTELDFGHLTDNEKFSLVKALGKALV